jgi:hypothetical protein
MQDNIFVKDNFIHIHGVPNICLVLFKLILLSFQSLETPSELCRLPQTFMVKTFIGTFVWYKETCVSIWKC